MTETRQFDVNQDNLDRFLRLAKSAAETAGQLLKQKLGSVEVREKNPGDFVTQADIESQQLIHQMIISEFPEHDFLGEEEDLQSFQKKSDYCWIVDPLDGTTNFIHGLRSFCVSIALRYRNQIVVGCIFDPLLDEMYAATRGGGATLNGTPIKCSKVTSNQEALMAVSLPSNIARDSVALQRLINVLVNSPATIRRLGSTALNLCYVACGRLDAYWSTSAKIWDVAAGILIVEEAGGILVDVDGQPFDIEQIRFIAAATSELTTELIGFMENHE